MKNIKEILVNRGITINHALKQMDETGEKILFVVDDKKRLLGAVTDGDIRRWILKGKSLNKEILKVMNKKPVYLNEGYTMEAARELMISKVIECLPVIDTKGRITSIIRWIDIFEDKFQKDRTVDVPVVIMAGGEGVRLSPFTKVLPKPLIPVGEQPIVRKIIEKFRKYGCREFFLTLNYKADIIKAYFSNFEHKREVHFIYENKPLGTAGSLQLLKSKVNSTLYLINCDTLIEADYADILDFHRRNNNKITLVAAVKRYTIPYGVCNTKASGRLEDIQEKPEYDFLAITGLYVLEPAVLQDIPKNKAYDMTDLIKDYIRKGKKIGVYPLSEKSWFDMGQLEGLQDMLGKFAER